MATDSTMIDDELQSEIETLKLMFENEITVNIKHNSMVIDYVTTISNSINNKIKLIFAFKTDNIASTIIISLKNASKSKNNLSPQSIDQIVSHLNKKFQEEIHNLPIYQCIDYFNNELKQNPSIFEPTKTKSKKHHTEEQKKKEPQNNDTLDTEYIAFIRFNHLLHGKQHKKENEMLSELKSLKNCSKNVFGIYFYGKPGIICICATAKIIKTFAKKCNDIGKKSVISYVINIKEKHLKVSIHRNTMQTIANTSNEKLDLGQLQSLLRGFGLNNVKDVMSVILTGYTIDFGEENIKNVSADAKDIYFADSKYTFEVEIKTSNGPYATTNGNLYISIIGDNDERLVDKYKFEVKPHLQMHKKHKKTENINFKFEFDDFLRLNVVGKLSKIYFENDSKDSWQCEWVKIDVYEILKTMKSKRNNKKSKPKLKQQYQAKMRKWINKNCPRYAYLSIL